MKYTREDFNTGKKEIDTRQYQQYKKLSVEQLDKINSLRDFIGKEVFYLRGKSKIKMTIVHIPESIKDIKNDQYGSWPMNIRLNYADGKEREHEGFWTWNVDKIIF